MTSIILPCNQLVKGVRSAALESGTEQRFHKQGKRMAFASTLLS